MKKVLYIGNFSFPFGNASGKRVYGMGKALREIGYEVIFIGMDSSLEKKIELEDTVKEYDGFKYYNIPYPKTNFEWLCFFGVLKKIIKFINEEKVIKNLNSVILYGCLRVSLLNYLLIKWLKRKKIRIISDCVDWLSVKTDNYLFDFIKWADTTYQKSFLNKKVDIVICISEYLEEYYKKYGLKTILIPPLSPFKYNNQKIKSKEKIKIIYAGLPFRKGKKISNPIELKDRIDLIIDLLIELKNQEVKFKFDIFGFNKNEYLEVLPQEEKKLKELEGYIYFNGYKSNEIVIQNLKKSDYTVLLRDKKRDTMAGFPTKIAESISYGIPVITNESSDLKKYIDNKNNGYIIESKRDIEMLIENMLKNNVLKVNTNLFYYKNKIYLHKLKKKLELNME